MKLIHIFFVLIVFLSINCKENSKNKIIEENNIHVNSKYVRDNKYGKFTEMNENEDSRGYYLIDSRNDSIIKKIFLKDYNPFFNLDLPILYSSIERFILSSNYSYEDYLKQGFIYYDLRNIKSNDLPLFLKSNLISSTNRNCELIFGSSNCSPIIDNDFLILNFSLNITGLIKNEPKTIAVSSRYLVFNKTGDIIYDKTDYFQKYRQESKVFDDFIVLLTFGIENGHEDFGFRIINLEKKEVVFIKHFQHIGSEIYFPSKPVDVNLDYLIVPIKVNGIICELFLFSRKNLKVYNIKVDIKENFSEILIKQGEIFLFDPGCADCYDNYPPREKLIPFENFKLIK